MRTEPQQGKRIELLNAFQLTILILVARVPTASGLVFNVMLTSLTNHNTSAYSTYNQANFGSNFGTKSWINKNGTTVDIDPSRRDESLNPITPGHVSHTDVHTLIPSRPDLRWFAHATPWFGGSHHINIGLNNNTDDYVAAMVGDMKNRGFNGVIIDWYGPGSISDGVTLKLQSYLLGLTSNVFTFIVMIDKGALRGTNLALLEASLQTDVQYCQSRYFKDPNYEHDPQPMGCRF